MKKYKLEWYVDKENQDRYRIISNANGNQIANPGQGFSSLTNMENNLVCLMEFALEAIGLQVLNRDDLKSRAKNIVAQSQKVK